MHLVALVVVAEDDEPAAERRLRGGDARVHLLVGQPQVVLGQRLAFGDVLLFVGRKQWYQHVCRNFSQGALLSITPGRTPLFLVLG